LKPPIGQVVSDLLRHKVSIAAVVIVLAAFLAGALVWPSIVDMGNQSTISLTSTATAYSPTSTLEVVYSSATSPATKAKWLPTSNQVVSWTTASNYVGQYVTVEGIVVYTFYSSTSTTFLDFHYPYQGYFYAESSLVICQTSSSHHLHST
jgi:hypothetical protein